MRTSDFDFELPEASIARRPASARDASRLLVLPKGGELEHRGFAEIEALLRPGDVLVVNDSRVLPARLRAHKAGSGGKVEVLLVESEADDSSWIAMLGASKRVKAGGRLLLSTGEAIEVLEERGEGFYLLKLPRPGPELAHALGELPLPPYLDRAADAQDGERYQTVYAGEGRSVAAPTAGLHFTEALLERLAAIGVERHAVRLDVGPGTFMPVRSDELSEHRMHRERFEVSETTAAALERARAEGRRVVAVGTTSMRVLESFEGPVTPGAGSTDIFIKPGHVFRHVDAMLTNFHLPKSTLLMLVAAFAGTERILAAYREAVASGYRFYSYGDAMFLERAA